MTCKGRIQGGVVVLEPGSSLPEGTLVQVEPMESADDLENLRQGLLEIAGSVTGLPSDLARNHGHYIHGTPKE